MEENFNLSEKIEKTHFNEPIDMLRVEDVKKHLQEFKEELKNDLITDDISIYDYIKETYTNAELQKAVEQQIDRCLKYIDTQMQKHFGDKLL